ncbi:MAG: hypothetical protein RLZ55_908, partial [Actinomycetota bacterium]
IYGFRGAALGNIEAFPQHFRRADGAPADVHTLRANFRSGATIVAIANASAAAQSAAAEAGQPPMAVGRPTADAAEVRAFESHADETAFVVDVVADEIARGRAPEDVLVLARANTDVGHYANALESAGIPATSSVDAGLFEVPVVRDVLAMLAAATDPGSNDELARLLIGPRWRIGVRDLALLGARARELAHVPQEREPSGWRAALRQATAGSDPVESASLRDALDDPGEAPYAPAASARFRALSAELGELARHAGDPVVELVARSLWMSGLDVESRLSATAERDCAAVDALLEVASRYYDAEPGSGVQGFLRAVRLARQSDDQPSFTAPDLPGCVRVMTIHKAKGLEAGLVIVPGMYAGAFDKATLKGHWTTTAAALPEDLRGDVATAGVLAPRTKGAVAAIKEPARDRLAAEQNRLVYVALTRARERLIVSSHVWYPASKQPRDPSAHLGLVAGVDGVASEAPIEVAAGTANPLREAPETAAFPQWRSTHSAWLGDCAALVRSQSSRAQDPWQRSGAPADVRVAEWDADLAALQRERQARATATAVVAVPDLIGTSDLQRLIADPAAYALARRRPMPRRPSRAAALGTRFHDWVAQRWSQLSLLDDPEQAAGPALDAAGEAELERLQQLFERSEYADLAPAAVEFPFATVIAGQPTSGRIDAVYRTEDGWEVVDWKTNEATEADALQLAVYRLAWARVNGIDPGMVSAAFFYVRRGERIVPERLPGDEELSRMLAVAEGARQVN